MISHLTHTFLQNFNWFRDQGICLDMINNQAPPGRNQFYDKMLSQNVQNRRCIDIGFGTGLLSMLALKHGAIHIDAWEYDDDRHVLGSWIIKETGLQDRITLHHGRFHADYLEDQNLVVMHEIIGPNIWNEGLRRALPLSAHTLLPSRMRVEFDTIEIAQDDCEKIFFPERKFDPMVVTMPNFVETVQKYIDATPQLKMQRQESFKKLSTCRHQGSTEFYEIDFSARQINNIPMESDGIPPFFCSQVVVKNKMGKNTIFYPRITIMHGKNHLHWSWYDPILISRSGVFTITQDFTTGFFTVDAVE